MIPLVAPCITVADRAHMQTMTANGKLFEESTVREFEEAFAARVGCEWAVAVNSGTSALIVAQRPVHPWPDPFAIPSWSCVALRNALRAAVIRFDLVDVSWNVRDAFAVWPHYAAPAVVPHMFGRDTRFDITRAPVIEDWTLSLGGCAALVGDLGVCSFNQDKMISTGRGGIVFGDDLDLHARVQELVHYERHTGFGYSVAMSSMQAALGLSQLAQLDTFIARRRELAARYTDAFRPLGIECPDADCGSVFFRYLIAVEDPAGKVAALAERGVEAGRGVYPPLHRLAGLPDDDFPGTTAAVESLLSVPVHPSLTDADAAFVIEAVKEVCAA